METASALRDFLKTGVIRNAVNFPSVAPDEFQRLQPYHRAWPSSSAAIVGQMGEARIEVSACATTASWPAQNPLIVNAVLVGLFQRDPCRSR